MQQSQIGIQQHAGVQHPQMGIQHQGNSTLQPQVSHQSVPFQHSQFLDQAKSQLSLQPLLASQQQVGAQSNIAHSQFSNFASTSGIPPQVNQNVYLRGSSQIGIFPRPLQFQ